MRNRTLLAGLLAVMAVSSAFAAKVQKPRLIVLTDIGGDPDDQQSMIRLMTYSNEFDIEGLIASASGTPRELKQAVVRPDLIREILIAYGAVRPNLMKHSRTYPPGSALLQAVKSGDPDRSAANIGVNSDTQASRWIVAVVDRSDPRPVNVAIWGGAHDLAQALWRVRNDRSPAATDRFVAKLRVYSIGYQDETGPWIVQNFPKLFFILSSADQRDVLGKSTGAVDRRLSVYRGMYLGGDESITSHEWIEANVRTGHGPLGALYPPKTWTAPNPHQALKEGDTPSWFYFLPNGLSDPEYPEWGGWGGRFRRIRDRFYGDAQDRVGDVKDGRSSVSRWRPAFQNDFAARMDWCVREPRAANHPPVAVLNGDASRQVLRLAARSGDLVELNGHGSTDPDGGKIAYRWFHYPEPGGSEQSLVLGDAINETLTFVAPGVPAPTDFHIILEVKDQGTPHLTCYRRAIVRVSPRSQ